MNAAPSRRRLGVLLIWCGGVAMVLTGAFALAWWKLPEWQPQWVVDHSPWSDPVVRAMVASGIREDDYLLRAMDLGPSIGPRLRGLFAAGSEQERWSVMAIARTLVKPVEELKDVTAIREKFRPRRDGSPLSEAEALAWRDHLRALARDACAAGGFYPELAMDLMPVVYEPGFGPVLWRLAEERLGRYDLSNVTDIIAHVRDPRAVRGLMPLYIAPAEEVDRMDLGSAMRDSLAKDQVAEVLEAMRHPHPRVRHWGVIASLWVDPDTDARALLPSLMTDQNPLVRHEALDLALFDPLTPELLAAFIACLRDPDRQVRHRAVEGAIVRKIPSELRPHVLACLDDPEPAIRLMVIEAIATLHLVDGRAPLVARLEPGQEQVVRRIARMVDDPARGAAIVALGRIGDVTDFPLLLGLLQDDDADVARKARNALGYLPLTAEQQKQVDVLWEAEPDDDTAAPASATTSPP